MDESTPPAEQVTEDYEEKKKRFFRDLMQVHRASGQLSRGQEFGVDESGRPKRWGDPTEHCLVEAAASRELAEMIGLSDADTDLLVRATLVHDWRKKGEIEELRGITDPTLVEQSYEKSKRDLLDHGIPGSVVSLTETVAHTSLDQFVTMDESGMLHFRDDAPTVSLAMHYIDDITRGTELVQFDARMDYLDAASERYPYNENGRAVWGGRSFFDAQREVGHLVESRLAELAGVADPSTLPQLINTRLHERISNS